jgi:hypothetical protein
MRDSFTQHCWQTGGRGIRRQRRVAAGRRGPSEAAAVSASSAVSRQTNSLVADFIVPLPFTCERLQATASMKTCRRAAEEGSTRRFGLSTLTESRALLRLTFRTVHRVSRVVFRETRVDFVGRGLPGKILLAQNLQT